MADQLHHIRIANGRESDHQRTLRTETSVFSSIWKISEDLDRGRNAMPDEHAAVRLYRDSAVGTTPDADGNGTAAADFRVELKCWSVLAPLQAFVF